MRPEHLNELLEKNLITEKQHANLDLIISRKIFSVFFELRVILYLGVMLFTTGIGFLIYKNIGELGHVLSIIGLGILTIVCFVFAFMKAVPFSKEKTQVAIPYYDYVVLMGCLLLISVLGYMQYQYGIFDENLEFSTLFTAFIFFFAAYRFDHLGVLSLAITALASFWGISVSPEKWYSGNFFDEANLHNTALVFGAALSGIAILLDKKKIKSHFTFTYLNMCILIFLMGALAGVFMSDYSYFGYLGLLFVGCGFAVFFANLRKSFLFLLYAFVFGYIGLTYFLADNVFDSPYAWFFYLIASCGGFIYFIIKYKNYFKRAI
jgi:hypothetical protein